MHLVPQIACFAALLACGFLVGCEGRPSLVPNSDPALQRTSTQFAADAAHRFPYPAAAPREGDAKGRVEVDLMLGTLQLLNYSNEDWTDIDIWVNQSYVCHLPKISRSKEKVETINFQMLYNNSGDFFWTDGGKAPIKQVEIYRDGKLYRVPLALAD